MPPGGQAPWEPQDLHITWVQGQSLHSALQLATSATLAPSLDAKPLTKHEGIVSRAKKRVKFDVSHSAGPAPSPSTAPAILVQSSATKRPLPASSPQTTRGECDGFIRDLCKAMATCGMTPTQLGALADPADPADGLNYLVCSQPDSRIVQAEISLYEILRREKSRPLKRRSDRFQIALGVASAHLQLRSTPWARRQWEAKDILFPVEADDEDKVVFEPYISADFNDSLHTKNKQPKQTDRSFAGLGIMLLELCFGVLLDEHEMWSKPGFEQNKFDPDVRAMVASKWTDDVEGEAGPDFSAAVMWCLRESPKTLDGDQWRKDLANQVVMPLKHCWDCIKPKAVT